MPDNKAKYISVAVITEGEQSRAVTGSPPNPTPPVTQTLWVAGLSCELLNFALDTDGTTPPLLNIQGDATGLTGPFGNDQSLTFAQVLDADKNIVCIACNAQSSETDYTVALLTFAPGSDGNAAPIRTVTGNLTNFAVYGVGPDPQRNQMGVCIDGSGNIYAVDGNGGNGGVTLDGYILKFPPAANGNVASTYFVAPTNTKKYTSLFFDATRNLVWAVNQGTPSAIFPSIDAYNLAGTLVHSIGGNATGIFTPEQVWVDPAGKIYLADSVLAGFVWPAGSDGNVAPTQNFNSDNTQHPCGIAVDANGHIYLSSTNFFGVNNAIEVYPNDANGTVVPLQTMTNDALNHVGDPPTTTGAMQLFVG